MKKAKSSNSKSAGSTITTMTKYNSSSNVNTKSVINPELLTKASIVKLLKAHNEAVPYKHLHIENIFDNQVMRKVQEESLTNLKATFKESDLFKVFQTIDMGNLDGFKQKDKNKLVNLFALKDYLYSSEFRNFVESITGCQGLIDRVDCSMNAYTNGCHLLCHDDVIGTRRVSYIIYLTDADEEWNATDGGSLELYPLDPSTIITRPESGQQGVPIAVPTTLLLPTFNSMAIFCVQPGRSYHSVQEVFTDKSRLSISGWFHGVDPIVGSDLASLKQIMTKGDDNQSFSYYPDGIYPVVAEQPKKKQKSKSAGNKTTSLLSADDSAELAQYINPEYLKASVMKEINSAFCDQSSLQLKDFIRLDVALALSGCVAAADHDDTLGLGRCPSSYHAGVDEQWTLVGPSHKRRYLKLKPSLLSTNTSATNTAAVTTNVNKTSKSTSTSNSNNKTKVDRYVSSRSHIAEVLFDIQTKLFQSESFARYLKAVTSLTPRSHRGEVRRFRPGLDYTVAHYGSMTQEPRLDATLCFVKDDTIITSEQTKTVKGKKDGKKEDYDDDDDDEEEDDDDDDEEEEEEGGVWNSGDVGGFECYIEVDSTEETAEAAEVFQSGYGASSKPKPKPKPKSNDDKDKTKQVLSSNNNEEDDNQEDDDNEEDNDDDTSLLSVTPGFNVLSLVMRDDKVMRFIKYLSANAPSSRWDIAYEYEYE